MRPGRRAHLKAVASITLAALGVVALSGCEAFPVAIFRPESPGATAINDLSLILLAIAAVVLVGVEAILLLAVVKFRNRPEESAVQTYGNVRLETGWTVATSLVILVVLVLTVKTMVEATSIQTIVLPSASAFPGDTLNVRVVGHQWWWSFEYPQGNVVTANEMHIPTDRPIKVQLESADVIHSFWVPRLAGKTDVIPGQINFGTFLATTQGVYAGECAEFCGIEHAHMGFRVIAEPISDFSEWMKQQLSPAAEPATAAQRQGREEFQRNCAGCHTVNGTEASGKAGPNLTHFASRQALGANLMENNPANLARWIQNPQASKPGNLMPNLGMSPAMVEQVVSYVSILK